MYFKKPFFLGMKTYAIDYPLDFWKRHPALLIGIFTLLGTASALAWHPIYCIVFFSLALPFFWQRPCSQIAIVAVAAAGLAFATSCRIASIRLPPEKIEGEGHFHIDNLSLLSSPFNRSYYYKGILKYFRAVDGTLYRNLPCYIFHPLKKAPCADRDYIIEGVLSQKKEYLVCLKPKKGKPWKRIEGSSNIAQWRFEAKNAISAYVKTCISDVHSASFLSALITGDVDERGLRLDFSRLGLQHLLAISGFHFSFFALMFNLLLRPLFPFALRTGMLIIFLSAYYFFLGNAPSIFRAFTAICIFLIAQLIKRKTSGLNALGAALILELFVNPCVALELSFQLSFLCTIAILLLYPLMHYLCTFMLPERSVLESESMPLLDQHGYLFSALIRKSLSLNIAVCLFSLPVLLHLFHKFPLLSLIYNLFFPFCVTITLALFCCGLLFSLCPPLSYSIHAINSIWTSSLLQLTSNPPAYFDIVLRTRAISFPLVICILLFLFYSGVVFDASRKNRYD